MISKQNISQKIVISDFFFFLSKCTIWTISCKCRTAVSDYYILKYFLLLGSYVCFELKLKRHTQVK